MLKRVWIEAVGSGIEPCVALELGTSYPGMKNPIRSGTCAREQRQRFISNSGAGYVPIRMGANLGRTLRTIGSVLASKA